MPPGPTEHRGGRVVDGALPKPLVLQQLVGLLEVLPTVALHHGEVQQGDQGGNCLKAARSENNLVFTWPTL